jgi:hypothetical protein
MLPFIRYFERGAPDVPPKKRKNRESGGKHNPCVVRVQRRFVSLHGTIKRVEPRANGDKRELAPSMVSTV